MTNWFDIYATAVLNEISEAKNGLDLTEGMRKGVRDLLQAYKKISAIDGPSQNIDFDDRNNRAAYLYLYGPLHSKLVSQQLEELLKDKTHIAARLRVKTKLKIVSIGGGPGSDALGARDAISKCAFLAQVSVAVFDYYKGWAESFLHLCQAAGQSSTHDRYYGGIDLADTNYNLLNKGFDLIREVQTADVVTIVKFVSVIGHRKIGTKFLLQNIKRYLKPGAIILYIDNAAGGFGHIIQSEFNHDQILRPIQMNLRLPFAITPPFVFLTTSILNRLRLKMGIDPLYNCTVSVLFWEKPEINPLLYGQFVTTNQQSLNLTNFNQFYALANVNRVPIIPPQSNFGFPSQFNLSCPPPLSNIGCSSRSSQASNQRQFGGLGAKTPDLLESNATSSNQFESGGDRANLIADGARTGPGQRICTITAVTQAANLARASQSFKDPVSSRLSPKVPKSENSASEQLAKLASELSESVRNERGKNPDCSIS